MSFSPTALLFAHRGAHYTHPENSIPAFCEAVEMGVDAIETDVHMTRDGSVVVCHDPDGKRVAGIGAEIRRSTLKEVQSWKLLHGSEPATRIPTLKESLAACPTILFNVDLKQRVPCMVKEFISVVQGAHAESRVIATSFHKRNTRKLREYGFKGRIGLSRGEVTRLLLTSKSPFVSAPQGSAAQVPPHFGPIHLDQQTLIDHAHRLGIRVDYWTIDCPLNASRLLRMGADGIMTDDPRAILPIFQGLRAEFNSIAE